MVSRGDFADNPMPDRRVPFARLVPSETAFYWTFYAPMMQRIVVALAEDRFP